MIERLVPPGSDADLAANSHLSTPADFGGSFLNTNLQAGDFQQVIIGGEERLVTPTDEWGLPYCFAPTPGLPKVRTQPNLSSDLPNFGRDADLNHVFPKYEVFTSTSPALQGELSQMALAGARVQWVSYEQHHNRYNPLFTGPRQPQTEQELFVILALASAGVVPEFAIDLSTSDPKVVGLTAKQRKWLWTSGQVDVMCQSDVTKYLRNFVLSTDMDHIPQIEIEEFLYTFDYDRRIALAHNLAAKAVERAAEPLAIPYTEARRRNVLTFVRVDGKKRPAPDNPRDLVKAKIGGGKERIDTLQAALMTRLAQEPRRSSKQFYGMAA